MESPAKTVTPWPDRIDLLIFCASLTLFVFAGIALVGTFAELLGVKLATHERTPFRYGGTAVFIGLLIIGTLSFLIGGFVARRLKRVRTRWLSAAVGALYSMVMVPMAMLVPLEPGSLAGIFYAGFQLFFPALGLNIGALMLKRSDFALQPDRPQAGGG